MRLYIAMLAVAASLLATTGTPKAGHAPSSAAGVYRIDAVAEPGAPAIWAAARVLVRDRAGAVVARRHAVPAAVELPPGDGYTVRVVVGRAAADSALADARTEVVLNAGEASLALVSPDGAPLSPPPSVWRVYRYARGQETGELVARSSEARPLLILPAGWYEVEAEYAGGLVHHVIEVAAGRRFDYRIVTRDG